MANTLFCHHRNKTNRSREYDIFVFVVFSGLSPSALVATGVWFFPFLIATLTYYSASQVAILLSLLIRLVPVP
jgi:hypothetical protein